MTLISIFQGRIAMNVFMQTRYPRKIEYLATVSTVNVNWYRFIMTSDDINDVNARPRNKKKYKPLR
jgi:hypothetical protein